MNKMTANKAAVMTGIVSLASLWKKRKSSKWDIVSDSTGNSSTLYCGGVSPIGFNFHLYYHISTKCNSFCQRRKHRVFMLHFLQLLGVLMLLQQLINSTISDNFRGLIGCFAENTAIFLSFNHKSHLFFFFYILNVGGWKRN